VTGDPSTSPGVVWHHGSVERASREQVTGGPGAVVWITGLSGSGKSTVGAEAERLLVESGRGAYLLDGDNLRHGLNGDLGFSEEDRRENVRRVGELAVVLADAGLVAIVPVIAPHRSARSAVRRRVEGAGLRYLEVWMATPLEVCEERDPKGLYARARRGELVGMTGIDDPYEEPESPDLTIGTDGRQPVDLAVEVVELVVGADR
jgi:bifunctional enzyme CysN/CysC